MNITPPRLAQRLLELMLDAELCEPFLGDLTEEFARVAAREGGTVASRWYWRQALRAPLRSGRRTGTQPPQRNHHMTSLAPDLRLALRGFARRPGFTAVFVLTTALGVGSATAIFSAANPILFAPLPYPRAAAIVAVMQTSGGARDVRVGFNTIADVRERNHTFASIALAGSWQATVTSKDEATMYTGLRVSPEYFTVLGVRPALGRDFHVADDVPNSARTAILSHHIWRERFGADSGVINRVVSINDYPYTIIGVLPAGFEDVLEPEAELWRPLQYTRTTNSSCRSCQHLRSIARLKDGIGVDVASHDVDGILSALGREFPTDYPRQVGGVAVPLGTVVTSGVRPAMTAALVAVLLVLLIACANATNLLLGRASDRRAELAVRTALGAPRSRLVRQLLVESTILAGAGGVLGVGLAWAGIGTLLALAPTTFPRLAAIQMNVPVLLAALAATTVVGLGVGLLPALEATRASVHEGLQMASRRTAGRSRGLRSALVVAEMTLAVLVLTGSGLLLRSMTRVLDVRPGFEAGGVLTLQLNVVGQRFTDNNVNWRYYDDVLAAVRAVKGVEMAAFTSQLPLSDDFDQSGVHSERHPAVNPADDPSAHRYGITPGYLETMRIPVVKGRTITAADDGTAKDSVVLVNAAFASRRFPNEDPIGQRIRLGGQHGSWRTIVGVTGDIRQVTLAGGVSDAVYHPERQWAFADSPISLVVRTARDASSITADVRRAVHGVDKSQPILRVASMEEMVRRSAGERRFVLSLFEAFALLSALLAALGMYGVLAASVSERVREIGVREALGATPGNIVGMVVRQAMGLAGLGAAAGGVLAAVASGLLADQLFQTSRGDPATWAVVLLLLGVLALAACAVPAARAARVDPMESLRAE